jgi:6-pyruvoyltetrahydropterin/6-carboxytetrahydropterin synthase
MRWTLTREYRFEAAHQLHWHPGRCARLHGHSYRMEVSVSGPLDARGVVRDFAEIDAVVEEAVLDSFDHSFLNDLIDNPTCERLAAHAFARILEAGLDVVSVRLWETERGSVTVVSDERTTEA